MRLRGLRYGPARTHGRLSGARAQAVACAGGALLAASPAAGQVADVFIGIPARGADGSAAVGPADQLTVTPSVEAVYDSNVLRLNDLRGGAGPRDDVRVTPTLGLAARQQFARNTATLAGAVGYDFHSRFKGLERMRVDVAGAAAFRPGLCEINPTGGIAVRQAELEDLGVTTGVTATLLTGRLTARCRRAIGFYPVAQADVSRVTNSGVADQLNRINWTATGGVVYARPSLGEVQFFGGAGKFRRTGQSSAPGVEREVALVNAGVQFERSVTSRFAARASISGVRVEPEGGRSARFSGVNYLVDLRIAPFPALILSPTVSRLVNANINTGATYVLRRTLGIGIDWSLSARSGLTAQVERGERRYFGEDPLVRPQLRVSDETRSASAAFRYAVRSLRLQAGMSYRERDGFNDFYDFTSTRIEFSGRIGL